MDDKRGQDKVKEVGQIFNDIRRHLDAKENELRELKLVQPTLSFVDDEQVQSVISSIKSLHLTTSDGSFLFPSSKVDDESSRSKAKVEHRLPVIEHLLSLPLDAYLSAGRRRANEPAESICGEQTKSDKENNSAANQIESRSLLQPGSVYSRDFWLNASKSKAKPIDEDSSFDIDKYVEQTNEKIRRLHLDYLSSISTLDSRPTDESSLSTIKSIYPSFFERKNN